MEEKELEIELTGLGEEFKNESLSASLIPSTLRILKGKAIPSWRMSLRAIAKQSPLLRLTPPILILVVFFALIHFFSFTGDIVFNTVKIILLIFSFAVGSLFILNPEKMSRIDTKIIGKLLNKGSVATPLQERILFKVQGLYFILIAFFICKL